jgi:hypothetical protein
VRHRGKLTRVCRCLFHVPEMSSSASCDSTAAYVIVGQLGKQHNIWASVIDRLDMPRTPFTLQSVSAPPCRPTITTSLDAPYKREGAVAGVVASQRKERG